MMIKSPQEQQKIRKSLSFSVRDGCFYSIMDSFTSPFLTPFALALHGSNLLISLLVSLPGLVGSLFQLVSIRIEEIVSSKKRMIVIAAFLQALLWLPLLFLHRLVSAEHAPWVLLLIAISITTLSSFIGPLWKSMMGDLVDPNERGRYFSKRNLMTGFTSFLALFIAGLLLQHYQVTDPFLGFSILFGGACVSRLFSVFYLSRMYEVQESQERVRSHQSLRAFIRNLPTDDYGRFVLFLCAFRIAIFIAAPFFAVYMLKTLQLSYFQFTILTSTEVIASLVFLRWWGSVNDKRGSKWILSITGFMIPLIPLLWTFHHSFWYLFILQIYSGAVYSGFNLAVDNFLFDATASHERTRKIAYFNLLHGIAVFLGSIMGGLLLRFFTIPVLFTLSSILRFAVALALIPLLREMRLVDLTFGKSFGTLLSDHVYIHPHPDMSYEYDGQSWSYFIRNYRVKPTPHVLHKKLTLQELERYQKMRGQTPRLTLWERWKWYFRNW